VAHITFQIHSICRFASQHKTKLFHTEFVGRYNPPHYSTAFMCLLKIWDQLPTSDRSVYTPFSVNSISESKFVQ